MKGYGKLVMAILLLGKGTLYPMMAQEEVEERQPHGNNQFIETIFMALQKNKKSLASKLIESLDEKKYDVNTTHADGTGVHWALLHYLAAVDWSRRAIKLATILIKKGALLDILNEEGDTPLHVAVGTRHFGFAMCLLQHGARADLPNVNGCTPLYLLCSDRESIGNMNKALHICLKNPDPVECKHEILNSFTWLAATPAMHSLLTLCTDKISTTFPPKEIIENVFSTAPEELRDGIIIAHISSVDKNINHDFEEVLIANAGVKVLSMAYRKLKDKSWIKDLPINIKCAVENGDSVLHAAIRSGASFDILRKLVQLGASRSDLNGKGELPHELLTRCFEESKALKKKSINCDCDECRNDGFCLQRVEIKHKPVFNCKCKRCVTNELYEATKAMLELPLLRTALIKEQFELKQQKEAARVASIEELVGVRQREKEIKEDARRLFLSKSI